ncbi:ABC transporter permease [Candidatus Sumerlaeota bacterium]|nr:ABC transporter permease [Candidatus Sumerlaeota bacterium]
MLRPLQSIIDFIEELFAQTGQMVALWLEAMAGIGAIFRAPGRLLAQMAEMGYRSLPLAAFTGFFAGMVISLQMAIINPDTYQSFIGWFVGVIMVNEFGPVFTAIIIAGRVGAAMTAEISTMKVTEEIDALRSMGISPVRFLVTPRIVAAMLMNPILTVFCVWVGIMGGQMVATTYLMTPQSVFWTNLTDNVDLVDFYRCLLKSGIFGAVIATVGCHAGLRARGGAEGVGRATTNSVVISLTMILILDYLVTRFVYIGEIF